MWCNTTFPVIAEIITQYTGLFTQRNSTCCTNEVNVLWCHFFTLLITKVRDFVLLQEGSSIWRRYSPNVNAASQNVAINLDVITDSHLIAWRWNMTINPQERIFPWKWIDSSVMSYFYITDKKGERFNILPARIPFLTEVFTKRLLLAKMKWFICDVIPDCHPIGRRWNRTINPRELISRWKLSECFVMWYFYIADEKGERFNPVAGRMMYLMEAFTKC